MLLNFESTFLYEVQVDIRTQINDITTENSIGEMVKSEIYGETELPHSVSIDEISHPVTHPLINDALKSIR